MLYKASAKRQYVGSTADSWHSSITSTSGVSKLPKDLASITRFTVYKISKLK